MEVDNLHRGRDNEMEERILTMDLWRLGRGPRYGGGGETPTRCSLAGRLPRQSMPRTGATSLYNLLGLLADGCGDVTLLVRQRRRIPPCSRWRWFVVAVATLIR